MQKDVEDKVFEALVRKREQIGGTAVQLVGGDRDVAKVKELQAVRRQINRQLGVVRLADFVEIVPELVRPVGAANSTAVATATFVERETD